VQRVDWPTFNVADVVIALGIALCLAGLVAAAVRHRRLGSGLA
jgi:lipoprotein signal peptidase